MTKTVLKKNKNIATPRGTLHKRVYKTWTSPKFLGVPFLSTVRAEAVIELMFQILALVISRRGVKTLIWLTGIVVLVQLFVFVAIQVRSDKGLVTEVFSTLESTGIVYRFVCVQFSDSIRSILTIYSQTLSITKNVGWKCFRYIKHFYSQFCLANNVLTFSYSPPNVFWSEIRDV